MCVPVHTQRTCDSYFNTLHCTSVCIVCVFQCIHRGRVIAILMLFIARVFVSYVCMFSTAPLPLQLALFLKYMRTPQLDELHPGPLPPPAHGYTLSHVPQLCMQAELGEQCASAYSQDIPPCVSGEHFTQGCTHTPPESDQFI